MPFVVIDEVQKLSGLLDEVHWLHEIRFLSCFCIRFFRRNNRDFKGYPHRSASRND